MSWPLLKLAHLESHLQDGAWLSELVRRVQGRLGLFTSQQLADLAHDLAQVGDLDLFESLQAS